MDLAQTRAPRLKIKPRLLRPAAEVDIEMTSEISRSGSAFRNRLSAASDHLRQALERAGEGTPGLDDLHRHLDRVGYCVSSLGQSTVDAISVDQGGRPVMIAATPPGVEYAANVAARAVISKYDDLVSKLPQDKAREVQKEVFESLFPDARDQGGEMRAGSLGEIRIRPPMMSRAGIMRIGGHLLAGTAALTENLAANSLIGAANFLESMTTPVGVDGATPIRMYSSSLLRDRLTRAQAHSLQDIIKASTEAEMLVRGCLEQKKGIAQPAINPARLSLLESAISRQQELIKLRTDKGHGAPQSTLRRVIPGSRRTRPETERMER